MSAKDENNRKESKELTIILHLVIKKPTNV